MQHEIVNCSRHLQPVHHGHRLHQSLLERVQCLADLYSWCQWLLPASWQLERLLPIPYRPMADGIASTTPCLAAVHALHLQGALHLVGASTQLQPHECRQDFWKSRAARASLCETAIQHKGSGRHVLSLRSWRRRKFLPYPSTPSLMRLATQLVLRRAKGSLTMPQKTLRHHSQWCPSIFARPRRSLCHHSRRLGYQALTSQSDKLPSQRDPCFGLSSPLCAHEASAASILQPASRRQSSRSLAGSPRQP
mmetsp:Transcript_51978/g.121730  ORF Transcript_51978/g.121730 Transcript_51978/m.121730 type:complete len:250 (+) Transcript_51978:163-912(+)